MSDQPTRTRPQACYTIEPERDQRAERLAANIHRGSGGHGLSREELYSLFEGYNRLDQLAYTLFKCAETTGKMAFTTQAQRDEPPKLTEFTEWHHIDEVYKESWGFDKNTPGCYLYGLFPQGAPPGPALYLDPAVFYIGESRATTRNCMLGRRTDFRGTVRNARLSPYGCGTEFKRHFGAEQITSVYQAYLPMPASWCKQTELELLLAYWRHYQRVPLCNPRTDQNRVELHGKADPNV